MCDLDIDKDALLTHRNAPAAQNRYIYYPDHLVRMPNPGSIMSYNGWTEPIFEGLGKGMLMELFRPRRLNVADESISSFISRRFSPKLADNIVSAVIHGIYAGDIDKLSIRALMPNLWNLELAERSLLKGVAKTVFQGNVLTNARDVFNVINLKDYAPSDPKRLHDIRKASVFTLKEGLETLATAFKAATEKASANVKYDLNTTIESLTLASGDGARSDSRDITVGFRFIMIKESVD